MMLRLRITPLRATLTLLLMAWLPVHAQQAPYAQWRTQMKQALFIPPQLPALQVQSFGTFTPAPGVVAERVTYGTEFGLRVPAVIYLPDRQTMPAHETLRAPGRARHAQAQPAQSRMPALVVVNGHGGDKYSWYSFYTGILYARAGGVVLTYDPIGEGERNAQHASGTRQHDRQIDGLHTGERMGGQMVVDVMQAVAYLAQRPDVDPTRIAVAGYSMGSFIAVLAGAIDPRIHALVLSGGGDLDGDGGYWDTSTKVMCQGRPYKAMSVLPDKAADIFALNQQRGPTLILNGTADTVVDIPHHLEPYFEQLRTRVRAITHVDQNLFETMFFDNVGHRPSWVTRPAALWLQQKLAFPRWTEAEIRALPETHISEWAAGNGVPMDKGYLQEDREGGILALGRDVPNVPRSSLDVVPREQWERTKTTYIYETWVERALAADGLTGEQARAALVVKRP